MTICESVKRINESQYGKCSDCKHKEFCAEKSKKYGYEYNDGCLGFEKCWIEPHSTATRR